MDDQEKKNLRKLYFYKGLTVFLVVAACVIFFFIIFKIDAIFKYLGKILSVLQPVVFGLVIAYLVNPFAAFIGEKTQKLLKKKMKNTVRAEKIANATGVTGSVILFILIIFLLFYLVVPQFIYSISSLVTVLPGQIDAWASWFTDLIKNNERLEELMLKAIEYEKDWLQNDLTRYVNQWASYFASGVWNVVTFFKNFAIGLVFTIYLLFNKRQYECQTRKLMYALFKKDVVKGILKVGRKAHAIFSGFINGKLLDSLIIGILCFIGVTILRIPYTMLVAVVIGVTNIIPVFGPYIGAVPCAALILLSSPVKGLYFIIFIILLQALDGNVIGPKILGTKTGLATFWVVFAIVLGGGMFGVLGMLVGVPTFAVFYYIVRTLVNMRLKKKKLPLGSEFYDTDIIDKINSPVPIEQENLSSDVTVAGIGED